MESKECERLLLAHGVKPTANRIVVVKALAAAGRPLSLSELERDILSIDKSGVFRALTLFRDHHLVHAIEDGSGGTRYELCHSHHADRDDDQHPHFFCRVCRRTYCLEGMPLPSPAMPDGFQAETASFLVTGVCPECNSRKNNMQR